MKLKYFIGTWILILGFSTCFLVASPNHPQASKSSASLLQFDVHSLSIIPQWATFSDERDSTNMQSTHDPNEDTENTDIQEPPAPADSTLSPTWLQMTNAILKMFMTLYQYSFQ
ncbi:MAG: hypothetical protein AAFQ83_06160 [Bacteroidota bacterium]